MDAVVGLPVRRALDVVRRELRLVRAPGDGASPKRAIRSSATDEFYESFSRATFSHSEGDAESPNEGSIETASSDASVQKVKNRVCLCGKFFADVAELVYA